MLEGEATFVITSIEDGASSSIYVKDVDEEPDCKKEREGSGPVPPPTPCLRECGASGYYHSEG